MFVGHYKKVYQREFFICSTKTLSFVFIIFNGYQGGKIVNARNKAEISLVGIIPNITLNSERLIYL